MSCLTSLLPDDDDHIKVLAAYLCDHGVPRLPYHNETSYDDLILVITCLQGE
jgi:hypothetical protein